MMRKGAAPPFAHHHNDMMTMNRHLIAPSLLLFLPLLIGCGPKEQAAGPAAEALMKADMEYAQTISTKGLPDAMSQYLSDDVVLLPNNAAPIQGKEAVKENLLQSQPQTITRNPLKADVAASGDLGYTWGSQHILITFPNGIASAQYVKYLTVWQKDSGGAWKIIVEMTNASPPSRE